MRRIPEQLEVFRSRISSRPGPGVRLASDSQGRKVFRGLAVTFNSPIDCYPPSIIAPAAFTKTLQENQGRFKILYQHQPDLVLGQPTFRQTETGLEVEGILDDIPLVIDQIWPQLVSGSLDSLSIGWDCLKSESVQPADLPQRLRLSPQQHVTLMASLDGSEPVRIVREARLWEVSIVTWGADSRARIDNPALNQEALQRARIGEVLAKFADLRVRAAEMGLDLRTPAARSVDARLRLLQMQAANRN